MDQPKDSVAASDHAVVMRQMVKFEGGPHDGKLATVGFPKPFKRGMKLKIEGMEYIVRNGPIAEAIEIQQEPIDCAAVLLKSWDSVDEIERQQWADFVSA